MDWLSVVLGSGGVAFLGALFKGVDLYRKGASQREKDAVASLDRWRTEADRRATKAIREGDFQRRVAAYWQARAGGLEYLLLKAGGAVPPLAPLPVLGDDDPEESPHE